MKATRLTGWLSDRNGMQAEVSAVKAAMQRRVEAAVAETEAKAAGLRDAREKNVHFSARVVALNSRVATLQRSAREAAAREASLVQQLEAMKADRAAAEAASPGAPLENGAPRSAPSRSPSLLVLEAQDSLHVTGAVLV